MMHDNLIVPLERALEVITECVPEASFIELFQFLASQTLSYKFFLVRPMLLVKYIH